MSPRNALRINPWLKQEFHIEKSKWTITETDNLIELSCALENVIEVNSFESKNDPSKSYIGVAVFVEKTSTYS